ncbi:acyltransferase [Agaricicola taiwanensis]|uniref:Acyltransferase n=1 Tax=Agaricicola taiwanensis TaxID=591372 RepID=A0A8J2VM98_9RHOB|nr:acyltransferase family protein [Agaricicola taiwanensis]GGE32509.1 acyltransferase [Agaricicola taiwanensis]
MSTVNSATRVDWVDYAKGLCIIMVVMMHSTLGVEKAAGTEGWMHAFVAFARPFRMPDFFLISGLFLARVIDRDWRSYLDRKVVHFAYFYVLWLLIQGFFRWPGLALSEGPAAVAEQFLIALIEPFGTLWFIYLLPIFFVVAKLARRVPPLVMLALAALLESAPIVTHWIVIDEFANRFFFFLLGWYAAPQIFAFAAWVSRQPGLAVAVLATWVFANALAVLTGVAEWPVVSLILGLAGAGAVIAIASLLARRDSAWMIRHAGANSLVVYLAFFLPMAMTRTVLLMTGVIPDVGTISLIVTAVAVVSPLVLYWIIQRIGWGRFLFERPAAFRLDSLRPPQRATPAPNPFP